MHENYAQKRFLILGAGGHGKVVADLVRACGGAVAGFADLYQERVGEQAEPGGAEILVSQEELFDVLEEHGELPADATAAVVAIGNNGVRRNLVERLGSDLCPALVHPSAVVSPSAAIGPGTVVFPNAVINADATVGDAVIINTGVVVEHDCIVGDGVHISPQAVLSGGCTVGEETWIGSGASSIHGVAIGSNTIVGAGAVVIGDLPSDVTAVGNPARIIQP